MLYDSSAMSKRKVKSGKFVYTQPPNFVTTIRTLGSYQQLPPAKEEDTKKKKSWMHSSIIIMTIQNYNQEYQLLETKEA